VIIRTTQIVLVQDKSVSAMAKLEAGPFMFCETPPNTVYDGEDRCSYCIEKCDDSKDESKSDTVMGGKVGKQLLDFDTDEEKDMTSDGAREDGFQEETLLQRYITQLIKANPRAHTDTLQVQDMVCGWFICPPGLVHTLSCTNSAIFLTSVLKRPGNGHFLLATGRDNNGFELYLAWAFVKFENPDMWNWFLMNFNTALHMVSAGFVRFGMGPPTFTT